MHQSALPHPRMNPQDFSSNLIAVAVLNIPPTITAILVNSIFIVVLAKTRSLHTPSNVLLGALCISDLLVGFLAQPICLAYLFLLYSGGNQCKLRDIYMFIYRQSAGISFVYLTIISVDRCVAVCYPFKYQSSATCKRYVYIALVACLVSLTIGCLPLFPFQESKLSFGIFYGVGMLLAVFVILISYARIYQVIANQRKNVVSIGEISGPNGATADDEATIKTITGDSTNRRLPEGENCIAATNSALSHDNCDTAATIAITDDSANRRLRKDDNCNVTTNGAINRDICDGTTTGMLTEDPANRRLQKGDKCNTTKSCAINRENCDVTTTGAITGDKANRRLRKEARETKRQRKTTKTMAIILGLFLLCYLPHIAFTLYKLKNNFSDCQSRHPLFSIQLWIDFFVLLNSCVNPIVYCLRSSDIKQATVKILRMRRHRS